MWQARSCHTIYRPPQGSDAPEHLDGIQEFWLVRTVALQTGHTPTSKTPYSFAEYQALLITTAEAYNAEQTARCHPTRSVSFHETAVHDTDNFLHSSEQYDIDTSLDTIYANATRSCTILVPTDHFQMLSPEGCKQWSLLSDNDQKVLLTSGTTTTSSLMTDSTTGMGGG